MVDPRLSYLTMSGKARQPLPGLEFGEQQKSRLCRAIN